MELYRVVKQTYAHDLSGNGAALYGGRWNEAGRPTLYTASSRSLAILEMLVHLQKPQPPTDYRIMVVYVPDTAPLTAVVDRQLPEDWKENEAHTQQLGSQWLAAQESLLLRVPSVIVRAEYNYLLNPAQAFFAEVQLVSVESITFDPRFFQKLN
jgi:RES domain-containing protein